VQNEGIADINYNSFLQNFRASGLQIRCLFLFL